MEEHEQNVDVGGRDTRDSGGLPYCRGADEGELLTRFSGERGQGGIVDVGRELDVFKTTGLVGEFSFPVDVATILDQDLGGLHNLLASVGFYLIESLAKFGDSRGKHVEVKLRPFKKVDEFDRGRERSRAYAFQK